MFLILLFGRGRVLFFCCLGGGPGPAQTAKKITRPRPNSKKKNTPPPLPGVFLFCCLGGVGVFVFCCLGRGAFSFFCCLGGGRVLFFAVWAGVVFFFAVWAGGACTFLCCLGGGAFFFAVWAGDVFFFAVWAGDVSSLTYRSAWLVFERPNNKKDQTAKKNTGSFLETPEST